MFAAVQGSVKFNMDDQNKGILPASSGEIVLDFGDICRFCLTETRNGVSVHEKRFPEESTESIAESACEFISKLRIIEDENCENFPAIMCENCYKLIKCFYNFSQVCQKSYHLLRECYQNTLKQTKTRPNIEVENSALDTPAVTISNYFTLTIPQVVSETQSSQSDSVTDGVKYKEKLDILLGGIKKTEMKRTESPSRSTGQNEKMFACSQCSLQFSNLNALTYHFAATHNHSRCRQLNKFQCRNCRKLFSHQDRLKRHYKVIHKMSESDLTEEYLNERVKVSNEKAKFFCFQCVPYKQFQRQMQFVEHLKENHKTKETKPPMMYSCTHCINATFGTRLSLNQHLIQVHNLKEDDITWNDVKCVPVPQQHLSGRQSPEVVLLSDVEDKPKMDSLNIPEELMSAFERQATDSVEKAAGSFGDRRNDDVEEKNDFNWNCPECPAIYSRKQTLHCHMKEKHNYVDRGASKCPECSETFFTNRRLIQHGITVHQKYFAYSHLVFKKALQPAIEEEENRKKQFECDVCSNKYMYKATLRKHILSVHLGKFPKKAVTCSFCGKTLSSKLYLKSHIESVHEVLFVSCPICKKEINFKTIGRHYKTHRMNMDGTFLDNNFLCNLCGKVLKSKKSFDNHQKLHQNIRDEICDVCGKGFTTKKQMIHHRKTHEERPRKVIPCEQCEKVFSGRHSLKRHLLTHSGKKNFICEICSKCFYTIQELNRHIRHHKKDYKFDCQLCDMKFLVKSTFRHHMMKHRNVRPYKCELCEKMFIERARLNLHMTTKHNVKVHKTTTIRKDPKTYVPLDDLL